MYLTNLLGTTLSRNLHCLIRPLALSTTHLTFVINLDLFASSVVCCFFLNTMAFDIISLMFQILNGCPGGSMSQIVGFNSHTSLSPTGRGFAPSFVNYKKGALDSQPQSDKVYQLLAQGRWFSPASSTTKTGRHEIAEILLKVALKHQKSNQIQVLNSIPKPSVNYAHI